MLISKIRLKPATIGVVRSAAIPQAVKQPTRTTNNRPMSRQISGSLASPSRPAAPWGSSVGTSSSVTVEGVYVAVVVRMKGPRNPSCADPIGEPNDPNSTP